LLLRKLIRFLLLFPALSIAQGIDLRGIVTDSTTQEKLPFANIVLVGTNKGAATNLNGFYLIPNVLPGEYDLSVSSVGYQKKVQRVFVGIKGPIIVSVALSPVVVEMSEVLVESSVKRELKEINTSIHILDSKDIAAVPATVQEDVFRSIQILPGIVSTSDVNSHFYVRGGGGDQNLILLDGMKIYNPFHAFGAFSIFDTDIIKTAEVFTGAFPPGYGGRLSSVVNMSTRDGRAKTVGGKAGINFLSAKLQIEGPVLPKTQWLINARKLMFKKTLTQFFDRDSPVDFYDAFVKITNQSDEDSRFGVQAFFSGDDLKNDNPADPDYSWRTSSIGTIASGLLQERLLVHVVACQNFFEGKRIPKSLSGAAPSSTKVKEVGVKTEATYYMDNQDLFFFGFEFNFPTFEYKVRNTSGFDHRVADALVESWVWVRYQTNVGFWKVDGGLHTDVGSMFARGFDISLLQPRLNMSVVLLSDWKIKASYGRFTQNIITVNNEDDVISIFDAWIPVPEKLEGEKADHYVAGIEGNVSPTLSASLQGYYKHFGSLVTYNRDKTDALDPDYVNSKGDAYGAETLLRYGIPLVDVYAAYTIGWTTIKAGDFEYPPRYDRRHTMHLMTVFHPMKSLDLTLRWEFGSGFPFTQTMGYYDRLVLDNVFDGEFVSETGNPYTRLGDKNAARLPVYHKLDFSAVYRFTLLGLRGTLGGHIVNLYDRKNMFYFDRSTGRRINMLSFFPSVTLDLEY
jgi:hypothetical protein